MDTCISCGLCAVRCPIGAISLAPNGRFTVAPADLNESQPALDQDDFVANRLQQTAVCEWSKNDWAEVTRNLATRSIPLLHGDFYGLIARLFNAAGLPTWQPRPGDTSNRIDLILADEVDSLPVEIKSFAESPVINVKSVQQALENRIVLDSRKFLPSLPTSSTLVVGYDYPPTRSDVYELIEDVWKAFGINVGLISMVNLYELALRRQLQGAPTSRSRLGSLRGPLK